jgi:hypothetical protein
MDILNFDISYYNDIKKSYSETPEDPNIFLNAQKKVQTDLQIDSFPLFLSTKEFEKIKKENRKLLISVKFQCYIQEDDFKLPIIKQSDIDFMKHLTQHSLDWHIIETKKLDLSTYFLTINYFPIFSFCQNGSIILKHQIILNHSFEKCIMSIISGKEQMRSNKRIYSINEIEYFQKDNQKYPNDTSVVETDIYITYPDKRFKKRISVNSISMDKENNVLTFISKPILKEGFFENWTDKVEFKHLNYEKKDYISEKIEPLFLYEFIKIQKIDEYSTHYTLIELFPSIGIYEDKFNILKKHEGNIFYFII